MPEEKPKPEKPKRRIARKNLRGMQERGDEIEKARDALKGIIDAVADDENFHPDLLDIDNLYVRAQVYDAQAREMRDVGRLCLKPESKKIIADARKRWRDAIRRAVDYTRKVADGLGILPAWIDMKTGEINEPESEEAAEVEVAEFVEGVCRELDKLVGEAPSA